MSKRAEHMSEKPTEAAAWFARKRSGVMSAHEARELDAWLDRTPENRAAFDELEHFWNVAGVSRADPEMMAVREAAMGELAAPKRGGWLVGAVAASVALVAGGAWIATQTDWVSRVFAEPEMQAFSTGIGQTTTVRLADGSVVTLDTDSLIRTRDTGGERFVSLEKGRAYFRVAKDTQRPFIVSASGRTVTATGTAFDVRVDPGKMEVTLVEGRVRVQARRAGGEGKQVADLTPGTRLIARGERSWLVTHVDSERATSWINGQLTFSNTPMSDVAEEMNRYSTRKIVIVDADLARAPVVGAFRAGDVDAFVTAVKNYKLARVVRETEDTVELASRN